MGLKNNYMYIQYRKLKRLYASFSAINDAGYNIRLEYTLRYISKSLLSIHLN